METVINFENVFKSYPLYHAVTGGFKKFLFSLPSSIKALNQTTFHALEGVSLKVGRGERVGIIGRNGSGKSTTLGLMAGVLKPNKGQVTINGRVSPLLELGMGFNAELTGIENIFLNGILMGMTKAEVNKNFSDIIAFSEIGAFLDQPLRTYSSGMVARLAFSIIAHLDPEIMLIDEILAVGDIAFQQKCYKKMLSFKEKGTTIVLVSHSMSDIIRFSERVIFLDKGKIAKEGNPDEVIKSYDELMKQ
ncbi:MAG: ABC transporter ATP-binding protein [Candidatus Brocadiia bacterium]